MIKRARGPAAEAVRDAPAAILHADQRHLVLQSPVVGARSAGAALGNSDMRSHTGRDAEV